MSELLNYRHAQNVFNHAGMYASLFESYGMVLGLLAGGVKTSDTEFQTLLVNVLNDGEDISAPVWDWMTGMANESAVLLANGEWSKVLLPSDEALPSIGLTALAEIAQSFVTGFSCKQKLHSKLSHDVQELLNDMLDISHVDTEITEKNPDEVEAMLTVLEAHVELCVQICFEECAASLYPKARDKMFVLEDEEDAGKPVELSAARQEAHAKEAKYWEKQIKIGSFGRR